MLFLISSSKSCHGILKSHMASQMATPAENRSDTWLAPRIASLPNMLMFSARSVTRIRIGIKDIPTLNKVLFFICVSPFFRSFSKWSAS